MRKRIRCPCSRDARHLVGKTTCVRNEPQQQLCLKTVLSRLQTAEWNGVTVAPLLLQRVGKRRKETCWQKVTEEFFNNCLKQKCYV